MDTVSSIKVPPKSFVVEVLTKSVHASAVAKSKREAGGDILVRNDFICLKSLQITLFFWHSKDVLILLTFHED